MICVEVFYYYIDMASHMGGMRRQSKNVIYDVYKYFKSLENCEERVSVFLKIRKMWLLQRVACQ